MLDIEKPPDLNQLPQPIRDALAGGHHLQALVLRAFSGPKNGTPEHRTEEPEVAYIVN